MSDPERKFQHILTLEVDEFTELRLYTWSDRPSELVLATDNSECLTAPVLTVPQVRTLRDHLNKWLGEEPDGPG